MIELDGVKLSYPSGFMRRRKPVLDGLTFSIKSESVIGYLGINGAGKTTTIKLMTGINAPDAGRISIAGKDPRDSQTRGHIGYLPENPFFYEYLTAREAIDLYGRLHSIPGPERRRRAEALLERVELAEHADRSVREFSKGMRQRLGLAQALIHEPRLLILDEPLDGLDAMGRLLLRDLILEERERGRCVFFSSHILSDVEAVSDELVILDGGRCTFAGPLRELLANVREQGLAIRFRLPAGRTIEALPATISWREPPKLRADAFEGVTPDLARGQEAIDALRALQATILELRPIGASLEEYFLDRFRKPAVGKDLNP